MIKKINGITHAFRRGIGMHRTISCTTSPPVTKKWPLLVIEHIYSCLPQKEQSSKNTPFLAKSAFSQALMHKN